jgi:hypothetical protein
LVEDWGLGYAQEVIDGDRYEPIGCPHQCWSSSMAVLPALKGIAGIEVNERNKTIIWSPYFPSSWNFLKVKNVRSGDSFFNLTILRDETGIRMYPEGDVENYTLIFNPILQADPVLGDRESFNYLSGKSTSKIYDFGGE